MNSTFNVRYLKEDDDLKVFIDGNLVFIISFSSLDSLLFCNNLFTAKRVIEYSINSAIVHVFVNIIDGGNNSFSIGDESNISRFRVSGSIKSLCISKKFMEIKVAKNPGEFYISYEMAKE